MAEAEKNAAAAEERRLQASLQRRREIAGRAELRQLVEDIIRDIKAMSGEKQARLEGHLGKLLIYIKGNYDLEEYCRAFFEKHPGFLPGIAKRTEKKLTQEQVALLVFVAEGLSPARMAEFLEVETRSAIRYKTRLREQLDFENAKDMDDWLESLL
ncbi:MAG: hypothetical protein V4543_15450 [Bacteroidota bacterium]